MTEWVDLATALTEATMHPWVQSQGWHAEGCNMSQLFFYLDAAWLNESRCPGGRPSVSED